MVAKMSGEEEVEGDHGDEVESEPGFDVVERDGVDIRLYPVGLRVDVLLTEAEEDVQDEEDFHRVVDDELLARRWNAEGGVVGIHDDCVGGKDQDEQVEDVLAGRLLPDDEALQQRVLLGVEARLPAAVEVVVVDGRKRALRLDVGIWEVWLVLEGEMALGALVPE